MVGYAVLMGLTMSERAAVTKAKARVSAGADRARKTAILDELVELTGLAPGLYACGSARWVEVEGGQGSTAGGTDVWSAAVANKGRRREPMITMNAPFKRIKPAALSQQILALTGKLEVLAQAKRAPLEITGQHRLEQHWPAEETK